MPKKHGTQKALEWSAFLQRLKNNDPTLTSLNLERKGIKAADAKELSRVLKDNRTLASLNLMNNDIGANGARELSLALKDNRTLTSLHLGGNNIGADGAEDLSLVLKDNQTLTSLHLWGNGIGDDGAKHISLVLRDNQTLTSLDLRLNHIGTAGCKDISLALKDNQTLASLILEQNQIGADGVKALSLALKDNQTLTSLDLVFNRIGADGAENISLALKANQTLTSLSLGEAYGDIGAEVMKQIDKLIARNQKQIIQRRDQFIQVMVILARNSNKGSSLSLWNQLPREIMLHVIHFIDFSLNQSIGKSAKQLYQCAKFIFDHSLVLTESLQEAINTKQAFKIQENLTTGKFRFFPMKPQPVLPMAPLDHEKIIVPASNISKHLK